MDTAQVEIDLGFFPLMWMLYLVRPRLSVDGSVEKRSWNKHTLTLPAGRHEIEAWFPFLFPGKVCCGSISLHLVAGKSYRLRYRPGWLLMSGTLTEPAPVRQLPAHTD